MKMELGVPKRRHIKFRGRGITQKKTYKIIKCFGSNCLFQIGDFGSGAI
jgi:hypothetical protein